MKTEDYQHELLHIFFSQQRLILGITLLVYLCALGVYLFWPTTYGAYGTLLIKGTEAVDAPQTIETTGKRSLPVSKEDLYSEIQILQSSETIGLTLGKLDHGPSPGDPEFDAAVARIRGRLSTEVLPASNIIQLTLLGNDPRATVSTLDTLMDEYIRHRLAAGQGSMAQHFFNEQADKYRGLLESGEQSMETLFQDAGSADPQKEIETLLLVKRDLELTLSQLKNEAIAKQAVIEELQKRVKDSRRTDLPLMQNPIIEKLMSRLIKLKTERSELLRTYRADSQAVHKVEQEMAELRALIRGEVSKYREQVKAELEVVREQIASIEKRLEDIDARNLELQSQLIAVRRVAREAELQQQSYETFARRREEAEIRSAMEAADLSDFVSVVNRAYPSDGPVFPRPALLPLGLASGLLLGLAFGFSREYLDHTFKRPADVQRVLELPVVFSLPEIGEPDVHSSRVRLIKLVLILSVIAGMAWAYGPWSAEVGGWNGGISSLLSGGG